MESPKRSIKEDYRSGAEALRPFYQYPLQSPDFAQIVQDKSTEQIDRKALYDVIAGQYAAQGLEMTAESRRNLDALRKDHTYTITTGHQLVLFGGPLFTVYKVLSTIQLAAQLNEEHPDYHFVPLFWIHTEDHDFEEINHYYKGFESRRTYEAECIGPVGRHVLTEAIQDVLPANMDERFTQWYRPGNTLAEAFRGFMNELFGAYGIVILDPDHPELKKRFEGVIAGELTQNRSFELVGATSRRLQESGYNAQINPREINLFYLEDTGRNRIVADNGSFQVLGTSHSFSESTLLDLANTNPEYFSPNVSLRPLYQEIILPNLAYIGGWAEMAYWLQLKDVFEHYGVNFPLLLPRMMATAFRATEEEAWSSMGFEHADVQLPLPELYRKYMPNIWDDTEFQEQKAEMLTKFEALEQYIQQYSDTLPRSVIGQRVQTEKFFTNLEKKLHRVIRQQHLKEFAKIDELKGKIQAEGKVQERILSLAAFPELDPDQFVAAVYPHVNVLNPEHCYIRLANL